MRAGASCRRHTDRHKQREENLPEIIGFTGISAKKIAQRPLQEQQHDERQRQPLRPCNDSRDELIEPAQPAHVSSPVSP